MAENSKIEWCHHTQNFWIGCAKISPGCDHCYAAVSTPARAMKVIWGANAERHVTGESNWNNPLRWNKNHDKFYAEHGTRQRVFCQSLSDVLDNHPGVVDARARMWQVIKATPNLDWLLLTKRIGNAKNMLPADWGDGYPNVWLGASIVNQAEADRDIPKLLDTPARIRFLSMEPLLGPVDLKRIDIDGHREFYPLTGTTGCEDEDGNPAPHLPALDWIIVGGESGPGARPMHPDWARSLRDQCAAAGVPFLFKQWGEWTPDDPGEEIRVFDYAGILPDGDAKLATQGYRAPFDDGERLKAAGNVRLDGRTLMHRVGKKAAGRLLDGVQHDGYPEIA